MTLQELLKICKNNINSEVAFQEIVTEHDKQIRAEAIEEYYKALRCNTIMPNWCYELIREVKLKLLKGQE